MAPFWTIGAGRTGQDSAALQPDDSPDSMNRTWMFVRV